MRVLNIMPINYKGCGTNNNVNFENKKNFMPYMTKINFGNAASELPKNFGVVMGTNKLFRGGLPTKVEHFNALKEKGVTFIVDLCGGSPEEAKMAKAIGINDNDYICVDGNKLSLLENEEERFKTAKLVDDKIRLGGIGYIHCNEGIDRTGFFVAYYQKKFLTLSIEKVIADYLQNKGREKDVDSIELTLSFV